MPTIKAATTLVIPAAPERVWDLVVDPQRMGDIDKRVSLVSMSGTPGMPGSSYVLDLRASTIGKTRVTYEVLEGARPTHIRFVARRGRRHLGEQCGTFHEVAGGCRMDWQISMPGSLLLFPLARAIVGRQLRTWATTVSTAAQHDSPGASNR